MIEFIKFLTVLSLSLIIFTILIAIQYLANLLSRVYDPIQNSIKKAFRIDFDNQTLLDTIKYRFTALGLVEITEEIKKLKLSNPIGNIKFGATVNGIKEIKEILRDGSLGFSYEQEISLRILIESRKYFIIKNIFIISIIKDPTDPRRKIIAGFKLKAI